MEEIRAFIAIELNEVMRLRVAEAQERLRRAGRVPVRWVRPEGAHITLKFLGNIEKGTVRRIEEALAKAFAASRAFTIGFGSVGGFPTSRNARIIWLGLVGEVEALGSLRDDVERLVSPLGFPMEARPFKPHLTLGRLQDGGRPVNLEAIGRQGGLLREPVAQRVTEGVLFRSDLSAKGSVYTPLARFRLKG